MVEREEEQPVIKVTDRRKFNLDGSTREGFEPSPEPVKPVAEATPAASQAPTSPVTAAVGHDDIPDMPDVADAQFDDEPINEEDLPGAEDPASFINFLSTLATNAAAALGAMPHPATGQRSLDLDSGKYWLDVIAMLREKTKGNLHPQEARLLDGLLADMRMQYVQLVRATEERLKAQAAQKFSAQDILGRK